MRSEEIIKRLREELGIIKSCALMMAHAQTGDSRTRYLKTLNEKIKSMDSLLARLPKDAPGEPAEERR